MKIAVMSAAQTLGKTCFIELLGSVYSRSQGRDVVVLTTGNSRDNMEILSSYSNKTNSVVNPHTLKAMVEGSTENAKELLNYGVRSGEERLFVFDILSGSMLDSDKEAFFLSAMDKLPADLMLIEICGDVNSPLNKKVLDKCDCAITLVDTSLKGIRQFHEFLNTIPNVKLRLNNATVMAKLNPITTSDKKFAELIKRSTGQLFRFPYNPLVAKMALDGELDKAAYNIVYGDYELVNFRTPIQELMEFAFNTTSRKVIKGIDKWYR